MKTKNPDPRVKALVNGDMESENEFVQYQIERLKESIAESQLIMQQISKMKVHIDEARMEAIKLDGICDQYEADIVHFLDREEKRIKE